MLLAPSGSQRIKRDGSVSGRRGSLRWMMSDPSLLPFHIGIHRHGNEVRQVDRVDEGEDLVVIRTVRTENSPSSGLTFFPVNQKAFTGSKP